MRRDLVTGEVTALTRTERGRDAVESWTLPAWPTTVEIRLHGHGRGTTAVEIDHRDVPAELAAGTVQPLWEWALRELRNRLTHAPCYGLPWDR